MGELQQKVLTVGWLNDTLEPAIEKLPLHLPYRLDTKDRGTLWVVSPLDCQQPDSAFVTAPIANPPDILPLVVGLKLLLNQVAEVF